MCQTATPTLGRWTTCTTTTQNFKTLPFPLTLVLDLQITTLLVACPPASRVCVLQGSAVSSAHPGRQSTWYQHQSSFLDQLYFSSLPITFLKRERQQSVPRGPLGNLLTLSLTTLSVFLAARTMFGPIAGPGGTVFALLVLILFALIGNCKFY